MSARVKLQQVYPRPKTEPGDYVMQLGASTTPAATAITEENGRLVLAPIPTTPPVTAVTWASIIGKPTTFTPSAHATTHEDGGSDPLSVVNLAGFPGGGTTFLRDDGVFAAPVDPEPTGAAPTELQAAEIFTIAARRQVLFAHSIILGVGSGFSLGINSALVSVT